MLALCRLALDIPALLIVSSLVYFEEMLIPVNFRRWIPGAGAVTGASSKSVVQDQENA
jgi:hypothetical protein